MKIKLARRINACHATFRLFLCTISTALGLCAAFVGTASAQAANTVTLKTDGGEDVTGELVEFSNNLFRIQARVGLIAIPADGVTCIGAACPEGTRLETTGPVITLTARDGSATVSGNLIEISNGQYVLATDIGEMRIDQSMVDCEGSACVETQTAPGGNVVLTGGGATIEGILVEDLEDSFLVDVANLGVVRVRKDTFTCTGAGCP